MADDNGVFFSMAASTTNTSRLDVLRAKVRSSQRKVVASSKNILQQREQIIMNEKMIEAGEASSVDTTTSSRSPTGPLHMQEDSVTQLLQEQLRLVYADRASLKAEISALQRKHQEREATLQSEVMSFRYKYNVLKKEVELYENPLEVECGGNDEKSDTRDDNAPCHRRRNSTPPRQDYFQFFARDESFVGQATRHRRECNEGIESKDDPDSTNLLKLRDEVESFKAKEKNYQNEILFLQMELERIQIEQERQSEQEPEANKKGKPWSSPRPKLFPQQSWNHERGESLHSRKVSNVTDENSQASSQIDEAVIDKEVLKVLEKTREDLVELQEIITKQKEENKQVENLTVKLKQESRVREEKYAVLKQKNQKLEQEVKELADVAKRCNELEGINRTFEARCKELEESYNEVLEEKENIEERNQELEAQFNKAKAENLEFELMYDEIYTRSNDLLHQNEKLESRNKALKTRNLKLESEQAKLEGENRVQSQNCDSLQNKVVALSSLINRDEKTVQITNDTTGRSSEVVVPMSHSLSLYDSIYCSPIVRASRVRTWPSDVAENVRRKYCKIICTTLNDDGVTTAVYDIDELRQLSTSVLFQSSDYTNQDKIIMVLRWIAVGENKPTTNESGMLVHIMNGHSKRSRDLYMPLSESLTVYETVYNHEGVKAVIRRWPRDVIWRVANQRARIVCIASNREKEFAKYTIDELESLTLRNLYQQSGIEDRGPVFLVLTVDTVVKKEELYMPFRPRGFRQRGWTMSETPSKVKVRLKNETTQRSRDMIVPLSADISLFDAVYNSEEVQRANVRKWKSKFAREVKNDLSRLFCVFLGDDEAELRTCSVESLKTITTSDAKKSMSNSDGSVSILLRCVKTKKGVVAAKDEGMRLRIVNHTTRRTMFLNVQYSEELTLYDSIYNNPEVRAAQVRMWPKEVLNAIKDETATIQCHLFNGQASENELQVFTIQKLKETPTKRLFDLIPSSENVPNLVLKYCSVGTEQSEVMVHVSNDVTGRFKELEVPVSQDMTLYDIIYQSATIKYSYVRMWPSDIVHKVKDKTAEIFCVMMGKEQEITFSIEDMKKTTTTQLVELSPPPYDLVRLVLKCREIENVESATLDNEIEEIQIRITNSSTGRFRDLIVPLSADLSLYRTIYNNRSVKSGKVRVWPGNLVQDLNQKLVEVECAVLAANDEIIYTYTVEGMRKASTTDLFELMQRSGERINLLLRCEATAHTGDYSSKLKARYRPKGFRQRGWLPKSATPPPLRVRVRNEMTNRSVDLLLSGYDFSSSIHDVIYQNSALKRRGVRRWPAVMAKGLKQGSSEVLCIFSGAVDSPVRSLSTKEMCETSLKELLGYKHFSQRIELSLRCVATSVVIIDVDGHDDMDEEELAHSESDIAAGGEDKEWIEILSETGSMNDNLDAEGLPNTDTFLPEKNDGTLDLEAPTPPKDIQFGDLMESEIEDLGLYPEVFRSFGYDAIQLKSEDQDLGIYPEVFTSLGYECLKQTTVETSVSTDMYPEVFTSLEYECLKGKTLETSVSAGIYPEVFTCLGYEWSKGKTVETSIGTGMYPEVFVSLKYDVVSRKAEEGVLSMYPEVFFSLGFKTYYSCESIEVERKRLPATDTTVAEFHNSEKTEVRESQSLIGHHDEVDLEKFRVPFKPSGFRQRGWLPAAGSTASHFRARLTNETTGRSRDLIVPVSDSLTLFDAVYNEESVQHANVRHFPSRIALEVKQKTCEILLDVFIPGYCPIDQKTIFFGDTSDILIDDDGTAIRTFTLDDFRQTTTVEVFELMSQPKDAIRMVLRVKKVEAVGLLESRVSTLEHQLRVASEQAKSGSELLAIKLKALDEATLWNEQLSEELEELRAGMNTNKPPSPRSDMVIKAKMQAELLEQKEKALEQASERNESLKLQVAQLQKEIEILEVTANSSIMPDYKSVVDHVIEEEDDRDELSKDVSFKPVGFRQRGWLSDEAASMEMRLRVTNESTQRSKDFVIPIDDQLTMFDAVYPEGSEEDILDKTSNIQCIAWHDMGKDVRTFSVNALKQMSTKRFFELTSRRQDLLRALIRCQETAKSQVQELESEVHRIRARNEEVQNSMCVLSNELAASVAKSNKIQRELDILKQSQEGGLLFATELFEI